jgi:hypothetical protein
MTALLALERLDERKVVVIGSGPPQVGEESLRLRQGERLTVRQLLLGLLVKSANDAGAALAEAVDGNQAAFVRRMNRKAAALRLGATHYVTPYGLDRPGHQTSARDPAPWEAAAPGRLSSRSPPRPPASQWTFVACRFVTTNQLLGSYRWTVGATAHQPGRAMLVAWPAAAAAAGRGRARLTQRLPGVRPVRLRLSHLSGSVCPAPAVPAAPGRAALQAGADPTPWFA